MKALVTGASGLIGANIVRALLAVGHEVRALVRPKSSRASLDGLPIDIAIGDVLDPEAIQRAVSGCDVVFHAAVQFAYGAQAAEALESVAVNGTGNVLHAAAASGVSRVVLTSSSVVFGYSDEPRSIDQSADLAPESDQPDYVVAKIRQHRLAQTLALELGVDLVCVCPTVSVGAYGSSLGPSNAVVAGYLADVWRATFPGGCNIVGAWDVAQGHLIAATKGISGENYILGSENLTWEQVHRMSAELGGVPAPRAQLNHTLSYLAASAEELRARVQGRSPIITREQAGMLGRYYWYSHDRAASIGYKPRSARTAIAEAISWLAASPHISRETRANMHLHPDVYAARRDQMLRTELSMPRTEPA